MLLHADNFNYYGTNEANLLDGVYVEVDTRVRLLTDPDGLSPERTLWIGSHSGNQEVRYVLPAAVETVGVAFRLWMPQLPTNTTSAGRVTQGIIFKNEANGSKACLWVETTGALKVSIGSDSTNTLLAQSDGPVITAAGWYHIEIKFKASSTVGEVEVRVEGDPVITATGLNTGDSLVAQLSLACICSGAALDLIPGYYKDLVVWDGTGSQNNDFLGSVRVYELLPTADVVMPWDTTGANGFSVLDNDPPQDGVEYISAPYPEMPAAAVFEMTNLPEDVTSVKGIFTRVRAAKSDGGDGQLQVSLTSNGIDDPGEDRPITVAQTYWTDVSELDPNTGAPWTPAAVDAATLKLNRTL